MALPNSVCEKNEKLHHTTTSRRIRERERQKAKAKAKGQKKNQQFQTFFAFP